MREPWARMCLDIADAARPVGQAVRRRHRKSELETQYRDWTLMVGFAVEAVGAGEHFAERLKMVDLGHCDTVRGIVHGNIRACWGRWTGSRQLIVHEDDRRILFVEGQPDRAPDSSETAEHWLPGRTGSFRGFEIAFASGGRQPRITLFVDPLATRPIFLLTI